MKAWLANFIARYLIGDDPNPEPSRLDQMDGIK